MESEQAVLAGDLRGNVHTIFLNGKAENLPPVKLSRGPIYGLNVSEEMDLMVANDASKIYVGRMGSNRGLKEEEKANVVLDYVRFSSATIFDEGKILAGVQKCNSLRLIDFEHLIEVREISQRQKTVQNFQQANKIVIDKSVPVILSIHEDGKMRFADHRVPFFVHEANVSALPLNDILTNGGKAFLAGVDNKARMFCLNNLQTVSEKKISGGKFDIGIKTLAREENSGNIFVGGSDGVLTILKDLK